MSHSVKPKVGVLFYNSPNLLSTLLEACPGINVSAFVVGRVFPQKELSSDEVRSLQEADVLLALPRLVGHYGLGQRLPNLTWMHSISAGVDKLVRSLDPSLPTPSYLLTRNGRGFCESMAQYVICRILAHEQQVFTIYDNQQAKIWKQLHGRDLSALTLGILGVGQIGNEVARLAKAVGLKVIGLVTALPSGNNHSCFVDEYKVTGELSDLLEKSDYVCNVLPSTPQTDSLLENDMLSHCQHKKSVFINIGRGNVIRDSSVIDALRQGWLSHAILDVFESEPLSSDSPLWTEPNVTVTPHIAGTSILDDIGFVQGFAENYQRFVTGEKLEFIVDWTKGY